jgi:hypothetical protein
MTSISKKNLALLALLVSPSLADIYMHSPPGANDRNRERNENRNNGARMCDTQNNAKGGYPWCGNRELKGTADGFQYYVGSKLRIEWTVQHGVGANANSLSNVIIQYSCDSEASATDSDKYIRSMPRLRDGYPTGALAESDNNNPNQYKQATFVSRQQNEAGTNTIPCPSSVGCPGPNFGDTNLDNTAAAYLAFYNDNTTTAAADGNGNFVPVEFGQHESFQYYRDFCLFRSRNKGLYTADQKLNGESARFTRQNPNGGRSGLECPEERDYYPWWNPSPWKDAAILVADLKWCDYFQSESLNVKDRYYCALPTASQNNLAPLDEASCTKKGGSWTVFKSWGLTKPECLLHPTSRDNHLGNAVQIDSSGNLVATHPQMAFYDWTIPEEVAGKSCMVRLRYNMSSVDYPMVTAFTGEKFYDASKNCPATAAQTAAQNIDDITFDGDQSYAQCSNKLNASTNPVYNRPWVQVAPASLGYSKLAIAFNTNQIGRTFQDRSFLLRFKSSPGCTGTIYNLNNRGRRGNIVQCYPAVEFDFTPNRLSITEDDCVHIQFCGSDFNQAQNPNNGEGWQYSARHNILQSRARASNFPLPLTSSTMFPNLADALKFAFVGIDDKTDCDPNLEGNNGNNANNNIKNCGKLNPAPAVFDGGLVKFSQGSYEYVSTRNNNFSNRSQKGFLEVLAASSKLGAAAVAGAVVGSIAAVVVVGAAGLAFFAKRNPNGNAAKMLGKISGKTTNRATFSV